MPIINKNTNQKLINEVYIGKTKDLLHVEDLIRKIRNNHNYNIMNPACNTDKELLEIDRTFEKMFGFRNFCLDIIPNYTMGASTFALHSRLGQTSLKKFIAVGDDGSFKYTKDAEADVYIQIYSGLFMDRNVSEQELVAVILHEIGHNFETAISSRREETTLEKLSVFFIVIVEFILSVINSPFDVNNVEYLKPAMLTNKATAEKLVVTLKKRENSEAFKIIDNMLGVINILSVPFKEVLSIVGLFVSAINPFNLISALCTKCITSAVDMNPDKENNKIIGKIVAPLIGISSLIHNPFSSILGYFGGFKGESVSDNFATIYGYGTELNSALAKIGDNVGKSSLVLAALKNTFIGNLVDFTMLPDKFLLALADEHPDEAFRLADQATYLKQELKKKDIDPKMKKEIMKQVDDIERAFVKLYKNSSKEECRKNSKQVSWAMYKMFDGDIRSSQAKKNFEEIENVYKHAEKLSSD